MADYYCDFSTGNDTTGDGSSGTPWKTLKKATDTVTAGDHRILFSDTADDTISVSTTYTVAAGVRIFSVAGISTTYSNQTAVVRTTATNAPIIVNGGQWNGVQFEFVASASVPFQVSVVSAYTELRSCRILFNTGATGGSGLTVGGNGAAYYQAARFIDSILENPNTGSSIVLYSAFLNWIGGSFPTRSNLLTVAGSRGVAHARFEGVDLSGVTTLMIASPATSAMLECVNCKLNGSVVPLAASPNDGVSVTLVDCASGDTHYGFAHYDKYGSTVATTGTYAASGALWDGISGVSWSITTTASANAARPYVTPWIDVYHSGTAAITPYLESMRTAAAGAGTYYTDAEVWVDWQVKTGGADPRTTFSQDRNAYTAAGAAQTASSLGTGDWTGDLATASFAKLGGSFTPADKGYIRVRVGVGKASVTDLFVDPFVRGLS